MEKSIITPGLLYHNAPAMIEWLCEAFGFEKKLIIEGENKTISHAHLIIGNSGIMLSSAENYPHPAFCKTPKEIGGVGTVEIIVYIKEVDKHYENAKLNNAEIIMDIEDKLYGGRGYSCKDKEGHIWVFSSYNPYE